MSEDGDNLEVAGMTQLSGGQVPSYRFSTLSETVSANFSPLMETWGVFEHEWKACSCVHLYDAQGLPYCASQSAVAEKNAEIIRMHEETWQDDRIARLWVGAALSGWSSLAVVLIAMLVMR